MADRYTNLINLEPGDIARDQEDELDYVVDKIVPVAAGGVLVFALGIYNNMLKTWSALTTPEIPAIVIKKNIRLKSPEEVWRRMNEGKKAAVAVAKASGVKDEFIDKLMSSDESGKFLRNFLMISNTDSPIGQNETVQSDIYKALSRFQEGVFYTEEQIFTAFKTMADEGVDEDLLRDFSRQLASRFKDGRYTTAGEAQDLVDLLSSKTGAWEDSILKAIDDTLLKTDAFTTGVNVEDLTREERGAFAAANRLFSEGLSPLLGERGANFAPYHTRVHPISAESAAIGGYFANEKGVKLDPNSTVFDSIQELLGKRITKTLNPITERVKSVKDGATFFTKDENRLGATGHSLSSGGVSDAVRRTLGMASAYKEDPESKITKFTDNTAISQRLSALTGTKSRGKFKMQRRSQIGLGTVPLAEKRISRSSVLDEMKTAENSMASFETKSFLQGLKVREGQKITHQEMKDLEDVLGVKRIALTRAEMERLQRLERGGITTGLLSFQTFKQIFGRDKTDEEIKSILKARESFVLEQGSTEAVKIIRAKNAAEMASGSIDRKLLMQALKDGKDSEAFKKMERSLAKIKHSETGKRFQIFAELEAMEGTGTGGTKIEEFTFNSLGALLNTVEKSGGGLRIRTVGLTEKGQLIDAMKHTAILLTSANNTPIHPHKLSGLVSEARGANGYTRAFDAGVEEMKAAFLQTKNGVVAAAVTLPESGSMPGRIWSQQELLNIEIDKLNEGLTLMTGPGNGALVAGLDMEGERVVKNGVRTDVWRTTEISFMTQDQATLLNDLIDEAGLTDRIKTASLRKTKGDKRTALRKVLGSAKINDADRDRLKLAGFDPDVDSILDIYDSTFIQKAGQASTEETLTKTVEAMEGISRKGGFVLSQNRAEPRFLINEVTRVVKDKATQRDLIDRIRALDERTLIDPSVIHQSEISGVNAGRFNQNYLTQRFQKRSELHLSGMDVLDMFRITLNNVDESTRIELANQTQTRYISTEGLEGTIDLNLARPYIAPDGSRRVQFKINNQWSELNEGTFNSLIGNSTEVGGNGQKEAFGKVVQDKVKRRVNAMNPAGIYTRIPSNPRGLRQIDTAHQETLTTRILGSKTEVNGEQISFARFVKKYAGNDNMDASIIEDIETFLTTPVTEYNPQLAVDMGLKDDDEVTSVLDWWLKKSFSHVRVGGDLTADTLVAGADKKELRMSIAHGVATAINSEADTLADEGFSELLGSMELDKGIFGTKTVDNILFSLNTGQSGRDRYRAFWAAVALASNEIETEALPSVSFSLFSEVVDKNGVISAIDKWGGPLSGRHHLGVNSNNTNIASDTMLRSLSNILRSAGNIVIDKNGAINADASSKQSIASWNYVAKALGGDISAEELAEVFPIGNGFDVKHNLFDFTNEQKDLMGRVIYGLSAQDVEFGDGTRLKMLDVSIGNNLPESLGGDIMGEGGEARLIRKKLSEELNAAVNAGVKRNKETGEAISVNGVRIFDNVMASANERMSEFVAERVGELGEEEYSKALVFKYKQLDIQGTLSEMPKEAGEYFHEIMNTPDATRWFEEKISEGKMPTKDEWEEFKKAPESFRIKDESTRLVDIKRVHNIGDTHANEAVAGMKPSSTGATVAEQHALAMKVPKPSTNSFAAKRLHEKAMEEAGGKLMLAGVAMGVLMGEPDIQQDLNQHTSPIPHGRINNEGIKVSGGMSSNISFSAETHSKLYLDAYGETSNSEDTEAAFNEIRTMSGSYGPIRSTTKYPYRKKLESMQAYDYLSNI